MLHWGDVFARLDELQCSVDRIERLQVSLQHTLRAQWRITMGAIDTLELTVAAETDVVASAVILLDTIHTALVAALASNDPARIQAVVTQIENNKTALAAAVAANTDAAPIEEPPVDPPVEENIPV